MTKWSYECVIGLATSVTALADFDRDLDERGAKGWELVSIVSGQGWMRAYLKRPLND
jgi:hypothetical protein